jgi:CRP/FNR family transcriptional regulator, cyclic AMP receptor protein
LQASDDGAKNCRLETGVIVTLKEEVDLLRRIPLFANVERSKLKLLAFTSERIAFEAGQVLFREGDTADAAYILIEGEAEISIDSPTGPVRVAVLGRDAVVGEIGILCGLPRTATARAKERLVCLRIGSELFLRLVNEFPEIASAVTRELAHRLEAMNKNLRDALAELERLRRLS